MERISADPTSWLCAELNDWAYPISMEAVVLADLFDLQYAANSSKRQKPHPIRPWKTVKREHLGNTAGRSREEVLAILSQAKAGTFTRSVLRRDLI